MEGGEMDIQRLVKDANKLGAKGYQILAWQPPQSATDNPQGKFIYTVPSIATATETPWSDKK